ncbi:DoxX family protein [Salinactinospora qingdaonensis]|uniref:DoxX family protein n=1 Tax=Salinactinospora qingdaonensis TaxID=702744 RepID=A0ABP7G214_9ACTN
MTLDRMHAPVLSLFRIVTGMLFLSHGVASIFGVLGGSHATGGAVAIGTWPSWWAALIQLVCGGFVVVGLFTRTNAAVASGSMAYAYFMVHQPEALLPLNNGGELAAMYCWAFLLIAVLGPGGWALDRLFARSRVPVVSRSGPDAST